jgi:hypothetical protein
LVDTLQNLFREAKAKYGMMEEEAELIRVLKKDLSRFSPIDVPGKDAIVIVGPGLSIIKPALEKDGWRQVGGDTTLHEIGLGKYIKIIMERDEVRIGLVEKSVGALRETTIVPLALAAGASAYVTGGIDMKVRRILELESLGETELADKALDEAVQEKLEDRDTGEELDIVIDLDEPAPVTAAKKKKKEGKTKTNRGGVPVKLQIKMSDLRESGTKKFGKPIVTSQVKSGKVLAKVLKGLRKNKLIKGSIKVRPGVTWDTKGKGAAQIVTGVFFTLAGDHLGDKEALKILKTNGFKKGGKQAFRPKSVKTLLVRRVDASTSIHYGKVKKNALFSIVHTIPVPKIEPLLDPVDARKGKKLNPVFTNAVEKMFSRIAKEGAKDKLRGMLKKKG